MNELIPEALAACRAHPSPFAHRKLGRKRRLRALHSEVSGAALCPVSRAATSPRHMGKPGVTRPGSGDSGH